MKKRILSLCLVVAMVICALPASIVSAATMPSQTWSDLTVAADGKTATGYCPHCDTDDVTWTLLTRAAAGHTNITESGHYFLNKTTATNGALQTNTTAGIDVVIHLNGHTLKRNGAGGNNTGALRPMVKNTTISIVDSQAQEGAIHGDYGVAFTANSQAGTTFNFYSGNLTSVATDIFNQSGGAMLMNAGTFHMYGGTINGTKAAMGGSLYVSGSAVANIYGGTIQGGTATARGGNIYMSATTATLNIAGGTSRTVLARMKASAAVTSMSIMVPSPSTPVLSVAVKHPRAVKSTSTPMPPSTALPAWKRAKLSTAVTCISTRRIRPWAQFPL